MLVIQLFLSVQYNTYSYFVHPVASPACLPLPLPAFTDASQVPDNQGNGVYLTKTQEHIWILTEPNMPNPFFPLFLCPRLSHSPPCSLITQLLFSSPFPVFSLDIHLYTQSLPDRCYQFRPWPEKPLRVSDRGWKKRGRGRGDYGDAAEREWYGW